MSHTAKPPSLKTAILVNPPSLLQIVERLEYLAGKLPSRIRKAVLRELTPLKQLFLQQRTPRFLFTGSGRIAAIEIVGALFGQPDFGQTHPFPRVFAAGSMSPSRIEERFPSSMHAPLMIRLPSRSGMKSNVSLQILSFFSTTAKTQARPGRAISTI
jgi:hypothetical protein